MAHPVPWRELQSAAPRIADRGLSSLGGVAMLGTVRIDGSPRISPVEPLVHAGELLIGAMAWSRKAADLRRDPRYVLHSVVTAPDAGEPEFKLYGSASTATDEPRRSAPGAWWSEYRSDAAVVFALRIDVALYVVWDTAAQLMTVEEWSPQLGYARRQRPYP